MLPTFQYNGPNQSIYNATVDYWNKQTDAQKAEEEKLRAEGKPVNNYEIFLQVKQENTNAINIFNKNSHAIKGQFNIIGKALCELLGRANLEPLKKPKFKDENGKWLLQSLYLYPWYCCKRFYFSLHVCGFFKILAWSVWLISIGLTLFLARDNAALHKYENIIRYERAYYSNNTDVMMELGGIDIMFGNDKVEPISVRDYRRYIKEQKKEANRKR